MNYEGAWKDLNEAVGVIGHRMGGKALYEDARKIVRVFGDMLDELDAPSLGLDDSVKWHRAADYLWVMRFMHSSIWTQTLFKRTLGPGWDVLDSLEDIMDNIKHRRTPVEAKVLSVQLVAEEESRAEAGGDQGPRAHVADRRGGQG